MTRNDYEDWEPAELASDELRALRRRGLTADQAEALGFDAGLRDEPYASHVDSEPGTTEPWDHRCQECGEPFRRDRYGMTVDEVAEVYLDPDTLRANAGGQDVLVDDIPPEAFGPYLVHADPCYRTESGGRPKWTLA